MSAPSIENAAVEARRAALRVRIAELRVRARRHHRRANLIFLVAGVGFGSAVYLARTRFAAMMAGGRAVRWFVLVALGVGVFALGSWQHGAALRIDEEREDAEDELGALRRGDERP